ncbi:MAG: lysine 2,3-aminomutase [Bacteroidetes bacterium RIFOXYA12_FULL_33_9]|nr:MAG: lysine 2,3-aminomutase [Bacteroidetes bacterium RIFOXYA12_FULL_33_9]
MKFENLKVDNSEIYCKEAEIGVDDEPPSLVASEEISISTMSLYKRKTHLNSEETIRVSEKSKAFYEKHFPQSTEKDWRSWRWQIKNSFLSLRQLNSFIKLTPDEELKHIDNHDALPIRITPYYASLIDGTNPHQSIRKTVVPVSSEYLISEGESSDPLCEHNDSPIPNLVHRYPDRVLFLVTDFCATYCRYCTRSHMVAKDKMHCGINKLESALTYIEQNTQIRDVLLSGGDPLTMSDDFIDLTLSRLRAIPHVQFIRIGTKVPMIMPQRITKKLISVLKKYHPLFMSIHCTHPDELTPEVKEALGRLADAGIPLGSQTVLLKGINDNVETMKQLMHQLLMNRVRPYYLYQCDPILGSHHFRTSVEKGLEMIKGLRGHTSGYAIPTYVIDAPGGGGKIPLIPEYYKGKSENNIVLENFEGNTYYYPDLT